MVAAWFRYRSPPPPAPASAPASAPANPAAPTPVKAPTPAKPTVPTPVKAPSPPTKSSAAQPIPVSGTMARPFKFCSTVSPEKNEVSASLKTVEDFYRKAAVDDGWKRRLQSGPIKIDVNFVIVSNKTGYGNVSQKMVDDQMAVLNAAFSPDFSFQLANTQRVSNNSMFEIAARDPYNPTNGEVWLKYRYHRGGTETLNVYSLRPIDPNKATHEPKPILGFATYPYPSLILSKELDGVVIWFETMPGGSFAGNNEGDVRSHRCCNSCVRCASDAFHLFPDPCAPRGTLAWTLPHVSRWLCISR
jgi:hypothetical protein